MDSADGAKPERLRVEYLATEYLRYDFERRGRRRHHPLDDGFYEFYESLHRLRRANEVLEFLAKSGRDPYGTIQDLGDVLSDAEQGLRYAKQTLDDTGFLDLLDEHLDTVMRGVEADELPDDEAAVLESLGFHQLAQVVRAEVDLTIAEWNAGSAKGHDVAREFRQAPVSRSFDTAIERVSVYRSEYQAYVRESADGGGADQTPERSEPRKGRRWWKGLGQIVEGAALSVANAGMAVGAFKFPVSPEVQTYGAVVSVAGGVGKVMNGIGDLWGE